MDRRHSQRASTFPTTGRCLECDVDLSDIPRRTRYCSDACGKSFWARHDYDQLITFVLKRDNWTCQLCGRKSNSRETLQRGWHVQRIMEVDHIVPIADGGDPMDRENCRTLCYDCHKKVTAAWRREKALERVQGWVVPLRGRTAELVAGQQEMEVG